MPGKNFYHKTRFVGVAKKTIHKTFNYPGTGTQVQFFLLYHMEIIFPAHIVPPSFYLKHAYVISPLLPGPIIGFMYWWPFDCKKHQFRKPRVCTGAGKLVQESMLVWLKQDKEPGKLRSLWLKPALILLSCFREESA